MDYLSALMCLVLGVISVLLAGWNHARYWTVKNEGVATTGTITEVASRPKSWPRVFYEYEVEGHMYEGYSYVDSDYLDYAQANIGDTIPLVYYKKFPRFSAIRGFNNGELAAYALAIGSFLSLLGIGLLRPKIRQARRGQPAPLPQNTLNEP
jgi:hypothetical protein